MFSQLWHTGRVVARRHDRRRAAGGPFRRPGLLARCRPEGLYARRLGKTFAAPRARHRGNPAGRRAISQGRRARAATRASTESSSTRPTATCPMNSCRTAATSAPTLMVAQPKTGPVFCWKSWKRWRRSGAATASPCDWPPQERGTRCRTATRPPSSITSPSELNRFGLAYLHIIEPRIKGNVLIGEGEPPLATARLRKIFKGPIISAGGFEPDTAEEDRRSRRRRPGRVRALLPREPGLAEAHQARAPA